MRLDRVLCVISLLCPACAPLRFDRLAVATAEDQRVISSTELESAVRTGTVDARLRAIRAMARIQSTSYIPALSTLTLVSNDRALRTEALFALGQLGLAEGMDPSKTTGAIAAVSAALDDADTGVLSAAIEALGKLAPPDASARLIPLLKHDDATIRTDAATALFRLRFAPLWRKQAATPPELDDAAIDALSVALADSDATVRWTAAHALSRFGEPRAIAKLAARLEDQDPLVRLFTTRALARSKDAGAVPHLLRALNDRSDAVRMEAIAGLAALDAIDEAKASALLGGNYHVRQALATALGGSKQTETLGRLEQLAGDSSPSVRAAATEALARRHGGDDAAAIERMLADAPWPERVAATRAARHLGEHAGRIIKLALADHDPRVQAAAVSILGEIKIEGYGAMVDDALLSTDLAVRGSAVGVLDESPIDGKLELLARTWRESPGVDWIEVRESVADAVAKIEGESATALLRTIAHDDNSTSVRRKAQFTLERRGVEVVAEQPPRTAPSPFLGIHFTRDPVVVLETNRGDLRIRCLAKDAPIHVASFVDLVRRGFYDGLVWHRVVPNFVIQGGDPRGDGWGGPGYTLRDEVNRQRFVRGSVGMPKGGKDTGGCQIFITHVPTPHLDGNYTIFGVVEGSLDAIDDIEVGDVIKRARLEDDGAPEAKPSGDR